MVRSEIWCAEFGIPFGSEAGCKRPVLIVQDDSFNEGRIRTVVAAPLTINLRLAEAPVNVIIEKNVSKLVDDSVVVAGLNALDRDRFVKKISKANKELMHKVGNRVFPVFGIKK